MADSLTQKDIDSLLKGSGNAPSGAGRKRGAVDVIPYNFLRPPRIAGDRQASIEAVYGRFALSLQSLLSSRLRTPTDVIVSSVEQATLAEFIFSLASPCAAFVMDLGDKTASEGVIDLGTDFSYYLIDRLFGGPGEVGDMKRALTSLEQQVLKGIVERTNRILAESWGDLVPMSPGFSKFEATPEALQITGRDDNVLVANIEVRSGSFASLMTICLPLHALEAFLQEKTDRVTRNAGVTDEQRAATNRALEEGIKGALIEVTARFPTFRLRTKDLSELKEGAVIHTGFATDVPLELRVSDRTRFRGTIGQAHGFTALKITRTVEDNGVAQAGRAPNGRVL